MRAFFVVFSLPLALFGCSVLLPFSASAQTVFVVDSMQLWQDTEIFIRAGSRLTIVSNGTYSAGRDHTEPNVWRTPDGASDERMVSPIEGFLVPTANRHALVAKVGSDGTPIGVGSYRDFIATTSGTLFLAINDDFHADNFGYLKVVIMQPRRLRAWP